MRNNLKNHSRRNFMKMSVAVLGSASAGLNARSFANSGKSRPNLIFIMSDQMRGDAMGYMGNKDARTQVLFHARGERLTWKPEQRTAMARTNEWKLILNESQPRELYHMDGRRVERENVYNDSAHAGIVRQLTRVIQQKWDAFD